MFLKTGEMKKIMKASLKRHGLIVGNVNDHYLVYSDNWGVYVEHTYSTNKFKAAIMELIGDLPEPGECYFYEITNEKEIGQKTELDYPDPFELWREAKDFAVIAPMFLVSWPHEYMVMQTKQALRFIVADRALTNNVISGSELDRASESMPGHPSFKDGVLYFKNESTIYWVHTELPGHKALEVLFPSMENINFFEDDWIKKAASDTFSSSRAEDDDHEETTEDELPYV